MAQFLPQIVERCYYLKVGIGYGNESRTAVSHPLCPRCDYSGDLALLLHWCLCDRGCPQASFPSHVNTDPIADPNVDNFPDHHHYLDPFSDPSANPDQAYFHTNPNGDSIFDPNANLHAASFQHSYPDHDAQLYRDFPAASFANLDEHSNRYPDIGSAVDDRAAQCNALSN